MGVGEVGVGGGKSLFIFWFYFCRLRGFILLNFILLGFFGGRDI